MVRWAIHVINPQKLGLQLKNTNYDQINDQRCLIKPHESTIYE